MEFPQIDPVAIALGPLQVHWYGLMYVVGFIGACAVIALVAFVATAPLLVLTRALTMLCAPFRDAGETVTAARRAVADIERVERARRVEKARVARARAARVPKPLLMSSEDPPLSAADVERMSIYDAIARSMPSSLPIVVKEARAAACSPSSTICV